MMRLFAFLWQRIEINFCIWIWMKCSCHLCSTVITPKHSEYLAVYSNILCHKSWITLARPSINSVCNDKWKAKFGFQLCWCKSVVALKSTEHSILEEILYFQYSQMT